PRPPRPPDGGRVPPRGRAQQAEAGSDSQLQFVTAFATRGTAGGRQLIAEAYDLIRRGTGSGRTTRSA
ncbi:hypothetical protein, partial [Microbacterium plantarum]